MGLLLAGCARPGGSERVDTAAWPATSRMPASPGTPAPHGDGQEPWPGIQGERLKAALHEATARGHKGLDYGTARDHMYGIQEPAIDVRDGGIECIYTGAVTPSDGTRMPGGDFNTEHSWPKSRGAGRFPRKSDLHHLFPTRIEANAQRASYGFGDTLCEGSACPWAAGGSELGTDAAGRTVFEVRPAYRGDVARAQFYFSVRYRLEIPDDEEEVLRRWHAQDPPDERERRRNDAIEAVQGNRNPFVDHPQLVARIHDF